MFCQAFPVKSIFHVKVLRLRLRIPMPEEFRDQRFTPERKEWDHDRVATHLLGNSTISYAGIFRGHDAPRVLLHIYHVQLRPSQLSLFNQLGQPSFLPRSGCSTVRLRFAYTVLSSSFIRLRASVRCVSSSSFALRPSSFVLRPKAQRDFLYRI